MANGGLAEREARVRHVVFQQCVVLMAVVTYSSVGVGSGPERKRNAKYEDEMRCGRKKGDNKDGESVGEIIVTYCYKDWLKP